MAVTTTARDLITNALITLGVMQPGETVDAAIGTGNLTYCNTMLAELVDNWNTQDLTVLAVDRNVYDITAGKGSPSNPYTLGPGGDWDTGTAARPMEIVNANILLNSAAGIPVETPLAIITPDQYAAQAIKTQTNPLPQWLYYNPADPLGYVYLWNVPTNDTNDIVLYTPRLTAGFTSLDTAYVCPPGYARAFRLCLAQALLSVFGTPAETAGLVNMQADKALSDIKLMNVQMADLSLDPAFTPNPHGTYVIQTDQGA